MKKPIVVLFCIFLATSLSIKSEAKKIKNSFKIEKETKSKKESLSQTQGREINLLDTVLLNETVSPELKGEINKINFAGFDKELNSRKESFIVINPGNLHVKGIEVKIEYLDMNGRMFHSRNYKTSCDVPPGESRRMDIDSWDTQHTYYYYLGNKPKKVATPFQVKFYPEKFWIDE